MCIRDRVRLARGIDDSPVNATREEVKSIGRSTTLAHDITDIEDAKAILMDLADDLGMSARKSGKKGNTVQITIKYSNFNTITRQMTISPTCNIKEMCIRDSLGIANGAGAALDATLNFWGCDSGPHHASNPGGAGNGVTDNVSFDPWYQDEGFEDRSDGTVHNTRLDRYYKSIQAALDDAAPGDTIKVKAGVYNESVNINKSVTLTGISGKSNIAGPGAGAPIIDGTGKGDHVSGIYISGGAGYVVIEGFEIRNFEGAGASGIVGHGDSLSDLVIKYNHIHCVTGSAVLLEACSGSAGSEAVIEDIDIFGNIIECDGPAISWQAGDGEGALKDVSIRDNTLSSATGIHVGCLTENLEITGNSITSCYCGAEGLGNVDGSGIFSGNTVTMVGIESYCGVLILSLIHI